MKTAIALTAAGLMSLGIVAATPAAAYHLIPEGTTFKGTGKTSATKSGITLACKANLQGSIDAEGVGSVTGGSFTGDLGCTSVGLTGLPWKSTASKATKGVIAGVTFTSPIGNCGPSDLPVTIKNGTISFKNAPLAGSCTISGKIKTKPKVSIVP
jgi:hypothetical protein